MRTCKLSTKLNNGAEYTDKRGCLSVDESEVTCKDSGAPLLLQQTCCFLHEFSGAGGGNWKADTDTFLAASFTAVTITAEAEAAACSCGVSSRNGLLLPTCASELLLFAFVFSFPAASFPLLNAHALQRKYASRHQYGGTFIWNLIWVILVT